MTALATKETSTAPQMSKKVAEEKTLEFTTSWKQSRGLLLDLFEGKAHKALGYANFEDYAIERLSINISERTLHNHLTGARVERQLLLSAAPETAEHIGQLPIVALVELSKLPKSKWGEVYTEYEAASAPKEGEKRDLKKEAQTAGRFISRIVNRVLGKSPKSKNGTATTAKKNNMTPVVPPTYDGTEESRLADEAQARGEVPEVQTATEEVGTSEKGLQGATVTITASLYGRMVGFIRNFSQYYADNDSDGMGNLEVESLYLLSRIKDEVID